MTTTTETTTDAWVLKRFPLEADKSKFKSGQVLLVAQSIADCESEDWELQHMAHGRIVELRCTMDPAEFEELFTEATRAMTHLGLEPQKGSQVPRTEQ